MQPPDIRPDLSAPEPAGEHRENVPDDISRQEPGGVSTDFAPDTGSRVKRVVMIAGAVLLLGFIAVRVARFFDEHALADAAQSDYGAPPPVDIVVAKPVTLGQDLVLPGQTAAWYESTIYARVNGYVASWVVDIGDRVKKGQLLATIETPELDAELAAARAALNASEAQVTAREAEADFAQTTNERWRDAPKGVVSEQERESKKADYNSAKARLYAAKAQVALDQSRVNQYSALAAFKQVRAPFDGIITERKIDVGNLVTAGSTSATTSLYRITQNDPLRVFVDVPQRAAEELMKRGVPAQIRAAGSAGAVFTGKIARSADAINPQARTMRTEVDLPNPDNALVPGMYVSVSFQLPAKGQVEVPAAALIFRPGGPEVARVGSDGKVRFVKVTIARDDGSYLELGPGVDPGDRLVLNISSQIGPGEVVAVGNSSLASAANGAAAH
ncbi:MAG TPA: efflux RND transporter periplasmic adaptor subunit [Steroidobacteraceae bacterium]|jgi:RND family efflux transporter MFP subunit|nr:efflux RND transporter periplasmic adaptor subunit [Steroidobacteraceae bacterium]